MKILIVSQYFWPEMFRLNDLAFDLVERGHEVTVLTGNPNYPQGKFYYGYGFKYSIEYHNRIKIYRVPILPRGHTTISLILNYFSFVITGSFFALFHNNEYDKIFAVNFSPITSVYPAIIFKKRKKNQLFLWIQDLWPESVTAAGKINSIFVLKCLSKMVKHIYKNSDKVLVQSKAFIPSLKEKGVNEGQLNYMPNWAEDIFSDDSKILETKYKKIIPDGFRVMFAGNIGEAQDFDSILKAVELTRNIIEIKFIIIGDGRKKSWLENEIERLELQDKVFLLGSYPVEEMPSFFVHADIMLLSLKNEDIFALTIPSKLQSYMAFGKPILGMLNGIGANLIKEANCGYISNAADYISLANNIIHAFKEKSHILSEKGVNGKNYYIQNFSKKIIIDNLIQLFQE